MKGKKINRRGLTLIELLAVIAIIAILFIMLIPSISNATYKARVSGVQVDLRDYRTGVETYMMENEGKVPTEEELNAYFDKNLQFENGKSKTETPFGDNYTLKITNDGIEIGLSDGTSDNRYYGLEGKFGVPSTEEPIQYIGFGEEVTANNTVTPPGNSGNSVPDPTTPDPVTPPVEVIPVGHCKENQDIIPCNYEFSIADDKVTINKYIGSDVFVNIPSSINNLPVTAFRSAGDFLSCSDGVFYQTNITSVTIPNTITVIPDCTFAYSGIQEATISNSVTTLGLSSFRGNNLTEIEIPNSVTAIAANAFRSNQLTHISLPDSVTNLQQQAFQDNKIVTFRLPTTITKIPTSLFETNKITNPIIPKHITEIGQSAFASNEISQVAIPENVLVLENNVFKGNALSQYWVVNQLTVYNTTNGYHSFTETAELKTTTAPSYLLPQ